MKTTVVRYQTKPSRADENQALIEAVFAELSERQIEGLTYRAFRLEDTVSFVHIAEHEGDGSNPLQDVQAFQAFTANISDRCEVPPVASSATVIGSYRR